MEYNSKLNVRSHYTLGRIVGETRTHDAHSGGTYKTVRVRLLGSMTVSAFVGTLTVHDGDYVAVKISSRGDGKYAYNLCSMSADTLDMCTGAAAAGYTQGVKMSIVAPPIAADEEDIGDLGEPDDPSILPY